MNKVVFENKAEIPYALEEAINRLRVNVSFLGKKVKKIMVISSLPNEGKSLVTMQLWEQMAKAGCPSVMLDADMRKSVMVEKHQIVSEDGKEIIGTSHYLSGDMDIKDVIYHTDIEGADIIPNADNVVNPSMLIEGDRFKEMLGYLSDEYRYVFLDVPPLDLVSDGEKIGSMCDGAILVVRGGSTSKSLVRNSVRQLERAGCPLLGIVLNRVGDTSKGYYKKYGQYYYGGEYYTESK